MRKKQFVQNELKIEQDDFKTEERELKIELDEFKIELDGFKSDREGFKMTLEEIDQQGFDFFQLSKVGILIIPVNCKYSDDFI